ncbi:hypothetical protein THAOC_07322 [Thalassiosira oceanica]|uniref:Uncharacterized protein n=1 Tax=Thalassiosira oceanica TaxID=159749 RepID=K0T285_THAOC|nr:hypothetical protein THAOC_07322 [Thalassiosira oceanica]|eukprot:EJK71259.1 hypothetical protein THAOC_07322 [Thalassiosira oceanica]
MHKQSTHCETSPSPNTKLITTVSPSEADDDLANAPESKPSARTLRCNMLGIYQEEEGKQAQAESLADFPQPEGAVGPRMRQASWLWPSKKSKTAVQELSS